MAEVLKETGAGQIFDWDDRAGISDYVERLWSAFRSGEVMTATADIEKYSRRMTTRKMVEIFEQVTDTRP